MLNWIALWLGVYLFGLGGPLQNDRQPIVPVSNDVVPGANLPVFWGDPELQGLHVGIFIALAARGRLLGAAQPLDQGLRGAGRRLQPRGGALRRHQAPAGPTCWSWALRRVRRAGGLDGRAGLAVPHRDQRRPGLAASASWGIAVALLGRNTAIGTCLPALLFGALVNGTSVRNLDPAVFEPELADNLTTIIQGLVVLFVSAPTCSSWIYARPRPRRRDAGGTAAATAAAASTRRRRRAAA